MPPKTITTRRRVTNQFLPEGQATILKDRELAEEWGRFLDGKWDGMQLAPHVGFTHWNEDGSKYPCVCLMEPVQKPRMSVSRWDDDRIFVKNYGAPAEIRVDDFCSAGCGTVYLEVANDGIGFVRYKIRPEEGEMPQWLEVSPLSGEATLLQRIELHCLRENLPDEPVSCRLLVSDGETTVAVAVTAQAPERNSFPKGTFLPRNGVVVMNADHYSEKQDTARGAFRAVEGYGRYGVGLKVFPCTEDFGEQEERPTLTYQFWCPQDGCYQVELLYAPTNSPVNGRPMRATVENRLDGMRILTLVDSDFHAGDTRDPEWCRGVLDQIRVVGTKLRFEKGVQQLRVGALEAGAVLERVRIYPENVTLQSSYLGPEESWQAR